MIKARTPPRPTGLLAELGCDEGLEQGAAKARFGCQPRIVEPKQVCRQPGIEDVDLRRLHETLAQVGRPGRNEPRQKRGLKQSEVTLQGALRHARGPRQLGEVQQRGGTGRDQGKQARQGSKPFYVSHVADIPFQNGRHVRAKPCVAPLGVGALHCRRKSSGEDQREQTSRAQRVGWKFRQIP